ncbi:hypothetical protein M569_09000 [Genlisea aurea]|uniref:Pseudouridine synthase RsuA/RluA-like domain-containing protein n=1 Tax=Genlisea aurea TaxID=192259 RepID=S8CFU4_9LAMI|nr:hypothetical protein M569_09000 [Genlisea aurea]
MRKAFLAAPHRPRWKRKIQPPPPSAPPPVIRVTKNNIVHLGPPKDGPKPRQRLCLPAFPGCPLPGKKSSISGRVTAISWLKYYFHGIPPLAIQDHFKKGLVQVECPYSGGLKRIELSHVLEVGTKVHVPVTAAEVSVSKRFDVIPSGTDHPNADEIRYLQRLDSAILVLNKPPKLPVKRENVKQGIDSVHNSMDALAAAALSYDCEESPKLVHRLDRESSGLVMMGHNSESISHLQWLFNDARKAKPLSEEWDDACRATYRRYWALVIGSPKEPEGLVSAPLTKVLLDDGETEMVILSHNSGLEPSQPAITEYRVLGPTINGCSWIELRPRTSCKHQVRVHCAEALGTPIVGDYRYGWSVHKKWKQMPRIDYEPATGSAYRMRRPEGLQVQKGSVLSKVPLLHLHCREMVMPNVERFVEFHRRKRRSNGGGFEGEGLLRFVAEMPSHMQISWNLMCSYLV